MNEKLQMIIDEINLICADMPDDWIQFDVGYLRDIARRLSDLIVNPPAPATPSASADEAMK